MWCKATSRGLIPDGSSILGACPTYLHFLENGGVEDANILIRATMKKYLLGENKIIELPNRRASRATRGVQSDIEKKANVETKGYMEFQWVNLCLLDLKVRKEWVMKDTSFEVITIQDTLDEIENTEDTPRSFPCS